MSIQKEKYYSRRNLSFMLFEVFDVVALTKNEYFSAHDQESINMVLDTAENIAEKILRPVFVEADRNPPELINGAVKVHSSIADYYKAFCDSGLLTAGFDHEHGGQQLPQTVYAAADFILGNAHNGFEMFTSLAHNAAALLLSFGSMELHEQFTNKILSGEYTATMCLTETGAGSSLSDIVTEAVKDTDGSYNIKGQKIFISAGDHNVTDNIIHLVLARVKDAPKGTKGISLFVVPKKISHNGALVDNDVVSIGLYHKMGQKSTPALHLEFGGKHNCKGWLIGEEGKGLLYMFKMMNSARLATGFAGTYIASAAYYASLQYAKERTQGRRLNNKDLNEPQTTIIHHPDVRRMLFLQKAIVEGTLSFLMQCYCYMDLEKISSGEEKQRYRDLLDLLTPVAKTCGAEMGQVAVSNGLQVLGGYGYTEDFVLQQLYRDIRIMSLYEGTTGIQSQALLGRQIPMNNVRSFQYWKDEVLKDITSSKEFSNLRNYGDWLLREVEELDVVTKHLLNIAAKVDAEVFLSDANLYMELFGLINIGWQWLKQAVKAQERLNDNNCTDDDKRFYRSKLHTMKFFFHYELRKTKALSARLLDTETLTVVMEDDLLI